MKIKKAEFLGIDLRVWFENGTTMLFCGNAIDSFYESIGGFGKPEGREFDLKKFLKIEKRRY